MKFTDQEKSARERAKAILDNPASVGEDPTTQNWHVSRALGVMRRTEATARKRSEEWRAKAEARGSKPEPVKLPVSARPQRPGWDAERVAQFRRERGWRPGKFNPNYLGQVLEAPKEN